MADFEVWTRENLEKLTRELTEENRALRERVAQLEADRRTALDAWRKSAVDNEH